MKKTKIISFILMLLIICSCSGCLGAHGNRAFANHLKEIEENYNLKDKCEIISGTRGTDAMGYETREKKVQIKNTDFIFIMYSVRSDTGIPHYSLSDDYEETMTEYYREKFSSLFENNLFDNYIENAFTIDVSTEQNYNDSIYYLAEIKKSITEDAKKYDFKIPVSYYFHFTLTKEYLNSQTEEKASFRLELTEDGYSYEIINKNNKIANDIKEDIEKAVNK